MAMNALHAEHMRQANAEFDDDNARITPVMTGEDGVPMPIACGRGCNFCCSMEVAVTASEAINIKQYVETTLKSSLEKIKTRVRHARRAIGDKNEIERKLAGIMCPLLGPEGNCSVYPVRPLGCRAWVSTDPDLCREDAENPLANVQIAQSTTLLGFRENMHQRIIAMEQKNGATIGFFELVRALHVAWQTPNFEARWYEGEPILESARYTPTQASVEQQLSRKAGVRNNQNNGA